MNSYYVKCPNWDKCKNADQDDACSLFGGDETYEQFLESGDGEFDPCFEPIPHNKMTNREWINSLSDLDLARLRLSLNPTWGSDYKYECFDGSFYDDPDTCLAASVKWLQSEFNVGV